MSQRELTIECSSGTGAGSRFARTHGSASLGDRCRDKNGAPIREGNTVNFLSETHKIRRVKWKEGTRLIIGESCWWLMPFTAEMCEVISTPNARTEPPPEMARGSQKGQSK